MVDVNSAETADRTDPSAMDDADNAVTADSADSDSKGAVDAGLDERKVAKGVAIGLPLVTAALAIGVGVLLGTAMAILVLAAGVLLGVIALFWASLRTLSGDAPLPPELEALDLSAHAGDALASRKRMLVRALKDLDNERALGKLEADDYEQITHAYREELKELLRRIDDTLKPHRAKAEAAARAHLAKVGLRGKSPEPEPEPEPEPATAKPQPTTPLASKPKPERLPCTKCKASNEPDAKFCKGCGATLISAPASGTTETTDDA